MQYLVTIKRLHNNNTDYDAITHLSLRTILKTIEGTGESYAPVSIDDNINVRRVLIACEGPPWLAPSQKILKI